MNSQNQFRKLKLVNYRPNFVRIPEEIDVRRKLRRRNANTKNTSSFDLRTIFYDIFIEPTENRILAIGPQWMNLKHHLLPLQLYIDGKKLNFKLVSIKTICLLTTEPIHNYTNSTVNLCFQFPEFKSYIQIDPREPAVNLNSTNNARLTVCTLQKDNPEQWVVDWINWYNRLHGVNRFVLYDNGSANLKNMIKAIKSLDLEATVVLVDWPFEYGVKPDKFAQRGAFNHCRLYFPVSSGYCINVDIDEYLVNESGQSLVQYIDFAFRFSNVGSVRLREHWIPLQISCFSTVGLLMRAFHHTFYRKGHGISRWGKTKYIYRYDKIVYNSVHVAGAGQQRVNNFVFPWYKHIYYAMSNHRKLIGCLIGLPRIPKKLFRVYYAPPSHLFYFHFRGLRNQPTKADNKHGVEEFDAAVHIEEPRIQMWCQRAGLLELKTIKNETGESCQ